MRPAILQFYDRWILKHPLTALFVTVLVTALFALYIPDFRLDASADSLVLENDQALKYYRAIKARYGSDDYLIITYTPRQELLSDAVLDDLARLRDELAGLDRIASVVTILDVPLIQSPPVSLTELTNGIRTLETPGIDRDMVRRELLGSPLYSNMLISPDGATTAIQVNYQRDERYYSLLKQRNELRELQLDGRLDAQQQRQLAAVGAEFRRYSYTLQDQEKQLIRQVRDLMEQHRGMAAMHLGGVPMIVSDSLSFIQNDVKTFGVGVVVFIVLILALAFRKPRWVILPMITCFISGVIMVGLLGLLEWRVTIVSSNFISLLLIVNLSLTIHLVVRYRELHARSFSNQQHELVREVVRSKFAPSLYTAFTTMVAFASLLVSGIRPVMDFGWMMVAGVFVAFVVTFLFFPAAMMLFAPGEPDRLHDITGRITSYIATFVIRHGTSASVLYGGVALVTLVSVLGISLLTVENRFIDYYKKDTEIYQGMELIDHKLGGTTPMDIVIDAPASHFEAPGDSGYVDPLEAMGIEPDEEEGGITASSYWFNFNRMDTIAAIHNYLAGLPETGKVLSVYTSISMLEGLRNRGELDDFFLSIAYKRAPQEIRRTLFTPYMSGDGNQLRFSLRIFESDPKLQRNELINRIRTALVERFGLQPQQVHLTGMAVLYNNMLQSLYRSQILTIGAVFLAILAMFAFLFGSLMLALIAIVPNMMAAALMLALMGLAGIPLDIMTITIAAICIGIAVDDTIHYIHRYREEFAKDRDYRASVERCHASIGRAMYFTSITITLGFSILALSNFIPIIYFGLLTGLAILAALLANLTLLPALVLRFRPVFTSM